MGAGFSLDRMHFVKSEDLKDPLNRRTIVEGVLRFAGIAVDEVSRRPMMEATAGASEEEGISLDAFEAELHQEHNTGRGGASQERQSKSAENSEEDEDRTALEAQGCSPEGAKKLKPNDLTYFAGITDVDAHKAMSLSGIAQQDRSIITKYAMQKSLATAMPVCTATLSSSPDSYLPLCNIKLAELLGDDKWLWAD
uniref:Uncharacterized protein n=1 Tax=Octactis speculum TaxID=3111310 RepID=A0A7S2H5W0_9STRA|mmetsp:Transcript_61649/g.84773  ORF Transcript_61649/g.84773 Transcript_61649/m.84773 type:complete len:196 (+) Transcript_61649:34-621(+)